MTAWIMLACGCLIALLGVVTLNGWRAAQYARPRESGWGAVAMGAGLALDGVPRLVGWSSGTGLVLATVALGLVLFGVVLQLRGGAATRARRRDNGG